MRLYITIASLWLLPSILWCSTQLPSLPMLPRILSPIVPLYWWCLQSNNYDHEPFMFCAAAFVTSRNAPPSFLICCHQQLMNSRRSLANRKGSIQAETGRKKESNINEPKYLQQVIWQPENAHRTKQFCQVLLLMKSSTLMGILFKPRHMIFMMYI